MPQLIWNQYSVSFRENFLKEMVLENGIQGSLGVMSDEYQPVSDSLRYSLAGITKKTTQAGRQFSLSTLTARKSSSASAICAVSSR
jgi:hypothetical protein